MKLLIAFVLAGVIFFIQRYVYRKLWNKNLDVSISFDREILYEDENNVLKEIITNRKYLPLPILQVKFSITRTFLFERQENTKVTDRYYRNEFFTVMPLQKITRTYPFVCSHRGFFHMENMDIICRSFFMDAKMIDTRVHEASVCVLPGHIAHEDVPTSVNDLLGDIEKNLHINEDPFTFAGIRDYQPFDSMHSINWKTTARHGSLLVNTYNTTFSKKVVLLLNVEANGMQHAEDVVEWAIKITSHLASYYVTEHIPTAMYTNGIDVSVDMNHSERAGRRGHGDKSPMQMECPAIDAGADMAHIRSIEVALARLNTAQAPASFIKLLDERVTASKDPVEYIIISNYRKRDLIDKYETLRNAGFSIHFIIPEYKLTGIEEEFDSKEYTGWLV